MMVVPQTLQVKVPEGSGKFRRTLQVMVPESSGADAKCCWGPELVKGRGPNGLKVGARTGCRNPTKGWK